MARRATTERYESSRRRLPLAAVDRLDEGRALLFWCREPDEKLTWVFPRHHRLLLPPRGKHAQQNL
jgi:hypothetical protein